MRPSSAAVLTSWNTNDRAAASAPKVLALSSMTASMVLSLTLALLCAPNAAQAFTAGQACAFIATPNRRKPLAGAASLASRGLFQRDGTGNRIMSSSRSSSSSLASSAPSDNFKGGDFGEDEAEDDDDDDDDELQTEDPYKAVAASEFEDATDSGSNRNQSSLVYQPNMPMSSDGTPTTNVDWGGALGMLRQRVDDVESGKSQDPAHVLFRDISSQTPNMLIGSFITSANPQVVQAMSSAVTSLLGGLGNPATGMETIVRASGERIGSLCFQLQMTGYMFRNAEYVMALRDVMNLKGTATMSDYKEAFDRLDADQSGFIDSEEVKDLLDDVYDGNTPQYEVDTFVQFFDSNQDGKISWEEFEKGLGEAAETSEKHDAAQVLLGSTFGRTMDDEDEDENIELEANVSGMIEVELGDGNVVEVEANEYIDTLKEEARALKAALRKEKYGESSDAIDLSDPTSPGFVPPSGAGPNEVGGNIAEYIASRKGDVKSLTQNVSPEVMETMKRLVDFVLEGGDSGDGSGNPSGKPMTAGEKAKMEMAIPGSALQQLALWQLVIGYKLRESEATGDYLKLLE